MTGDSRYLAERSDGEQMKPKPQLEAKRYFQLQSDYQMTLQRENAAKLEISKAEMVMEKVEAKLDDLKAEKESEPDICPDKMVSLLTLSEAVFPLPERGQSRNCQHWTPTCVPVQAAEDGSSA
ncbi:hypothetical protein ATANTOWER_032808 [Ataeniobius toweri]|uniref:Uncharacterized protein n=1 Tax=Ataeniobius toweri TaxID=208326 RepID=A0ABU7AVI1_9TELE|nr:hypothetical protein [Ataeniobius toweri]